MHLLRSMFGEKRIRFTLFAISLLAHLVVFALLLVHYGPSASFFSVDGSLNGNDAQHYVTIAKNLAEGNGYSRFPDAPFEPDAFRTPLLPLYFVPFVFFGGLPLIWLPILLLNLILAFAAVLMYKLARLFLPHGYAAAAGLAMALDPLFLYRSQLAEPDALFVFLTLGAAYFCALFWGTARPRYILFSSVILGISILLKPTGLYVAIILFACLAAFVFFFRRGEWRMHARHLIFGALILLALLAPWLIRNHASFGVWGISSVGGFNLYEFYTVNQRLPGEQVPENIATSSREPSRHLPNQSYFTDVAMERIREAPLSYAKEQAVGTLRNLFVSELPVIYYYGHSALLPFPYNPESTTNLRELLLQGDGASVFFALAHNIPKVLWFAALLFVYILTFLGWLYAWKKDRVVFLMFTSFILIFGYFVVASGPYVDAKYRMPAMPLIVIVCAYGVYELRSQWWRIRP
ncbi:MAG: glycosyltransferase family 39 protein [Patescibacteria group bacterium]|mgnify:CR=1 FL=1